MAPTRELAQQIESEAQKFAKPMGFTVVSIVGGHAIEEQVHNLRNGAEIVIATPGRLVDCLEKHVLVLSQCNYIVMDEADRMIDMGFEEDVQKVLDALPLSNIKPDTDEAENPELMSRIVRLGRKDLRYRQTVMFSATMPPQLERLAKKYMRRPATVIIGNAGQAVDTVEQRVIMVGADEQRKKKKLEEILGGDQEGPVIVFVKEKRMCEALAKDLTRLGVRIPILLPASTNHVLVEDSDLIWQQISRIPRTGIECPSRKESRCISRNRSRRTRYRCSRCQIGNKLQHGQNN